MAAIVSISFQDLFSKNTDHFLESFLDMGRPNIKSGMELPFELTEKARDEKISPILQLATPQDAEDIVETYLDIYQGSYPYKEMENINEVKKMIKSSKFRWLLFKTPSSQEVAGCFTYQLDFEKKRGYMRGFNVKREFQGTLDAVKAVIGSMIGIWTEYKDKIKVWYCENRTAHTKSQYLSNVCGIKPIAFLPNKDVFNKKVESDIMHVAYEKDALTSLRSPEIPHFIPEMRPLFKYANKRYNLGDYRVSEKVYPLDLRDMVNFTSQVRVSKKKDRFGYETITYSLKNSDSYFKFLYTPQVQNFEKTEYKVANKEELFSFLKMWIDHIKMYNVRYAECVVSAYNPEHQRLFRKLGFSPKGYLPSWKYESLPNRFNDSILFNWAKNNIQNEVKLLPSGQQLVDIIQNK